MDSLLVLISVFLYVAHSMGEADPCFTHQNISDVDLLTDHKYVTGQSCELTPAAFPPAWYRYTATPSGAIATSCPDENACGAKEQLWVNDSLPNYHSNITTVTLCLRKNRICCYIKFSSMIKNCNSFYVVQLRRPPNCNTNYCFNSSTKALATVVTTPTTSTTSTTESSTTTTKRVVTSSTNVTNTLLKTTFPIASKTTYLPSTPSTISVKMSSKLSSIVHISPTTSISSNFTFQPMERETDTADKNKSNSIAAALGATCALLFVAAVTTAAIYIYRKQECNEICIHPHPIESGDIVYKTQLDLTAMKKYYKNLQNDNYDFKWV